MKRLIVVALLGLASLTAWAGCTRSGPLEKVDTVATSVPAAGNTELFTANVACLSSVHVQCAVAGQSLDAFIIKAAPVNGTEDTLYSNAGDYTTPKGILRWASGDLTATAAGSNASFLLDTAGIRTLSVYASAASGTATVTCTAVIS